MTTRGRIVRLKYGYAGDESFRKVSPRKGNGSPVQDFCLENSMDRGTWRATVHEVAESDTTEAT